MVTNTGIPKDLEQILGEMYKAKEGRTWEFGLNIFEVRCTPRGLLLKRYNKEYIFKWEGIQILQQLSYSLSKLAEKLTGEVHSVPDPCYLPNLVEEILKDKKYNFKIVEKKHYQFTADAKYIVTVDDSQVTVEIYGYTIHVRSKKPLPKKKIGKVEDPAFKVFRDIIASIYNSSDKETGNLQTTAKVDPNMQTNAS